MLIYELWKKIAHFTVNLSTFAGLHAAVKYRVWLVFRWLQNTPAPPSTGLGDSWNNMNFKCKSSFIICVFTSSNMIYMYLPFPAYFDKVDKCKSQLVFHILTSHWVFFVTCELCLQIHMYES